jgi:4-amino-4-deoxy-L-arabinose transferase-like glycosyltransferase
MWSESRAKNRHYICLGALILLGVLLRVGYVLTLPPGLGASDETDYFESAQGILAGSFDATVYYHVPPVVPVLFAGVFALTGPSFLAARLFQCGLFFAIGAVAYLLGKRLGGRLAGLLCAALVALYPYFVFYSGQALTETAATLFIPLVLLLALRAADDYSPAGALLFGLSLAAASLTRASAVYFVLAVPLIFAIAWGVRRTAWLKATGLAAAGFLALYLPWCAVNYRHFGTVIPAPTIGSGVMLYQTALRMTMPDEVARLKYLKAEVLPKYYYPPGGTDRDRLEGDRHLNAEGKRIIRENLDKYPAILWENFSRFWQFYPRYSGEEGDRRALIYKILGLGTYGILFPFIIAGAVLGLRRFRKLSALYGFVAYFTLVHILLYGKLRYRLPMDPLLLAFGAYGFLACLARIRPIWLAALEGWTGCSAPSLKGDPHE